MGVCAMCYRHEVTRVEMDHRECKGPQADDMDCFLQCPPSLLTQELLIFLLPLIRGHSASISALATTLRTNLHNSLRFLLSKQEETIYEPIRAGPSSASQARSSSPGGSRAKQEEKRGRRRRGTYADLPGRTCAICHHRLRDTLDGRLGLPAIGLVVDPGSAVDADPGDSSALARLTGDEVDRDNEVDNEETRIHLPAKTDCEDECRYCFYCISEVLTRRAKEVEVEAKRRGRGGDDDEDQVGVPNRDKVKGWECLRCGEEVWGCIRITT
jgi:hypothetical protein